MHENAQKFGWEISMQNFPSITLGTEFPVSMMFSREFLSWKQAQLEGQQLQHKDQKRTKRKGEKY